MIVLEEGKGYIVKVECPCCNAVLGLNLKDIETNTLCGNDRYYTKCMKCRMNFGIPKELIPYKAKLQLKR